MSVESEAALAKARAAAAAEEDGEAAVSESNRAERRGENSEPKIKLVDIDDLHKRLAVPDAPVEAEAGKCMVCGGKGTVSGDSGPPDRSAKRVCLEVCCPNCETGRALLFPPATEPRVPSAPQRCARRGCTSYARDGGIACCDDHAVQGFHPATVDC